jgi:hypothetical protein
VTQAEYLHWLVVVSTAGWFVMGLVSLAVIWDFTPRTERRQARHAITYAPRRSRHDPRW